MMCSRAVALVVAVGLWGGALPGVAWGHASDEGLPFIDSVARGPFDEAMRLMGAELVVEARPHVEELERREPGSAFALLARARLLFLEGKFAESLEKLEAARGADDYDERGWAEFESLVRSTHETIVAHVPHPTSGGHFILYVAPGVDEVLIPYADEALERAYEAFGDIFGYRPPEPVPVHVYGRVEDLAAVSSLRVSEIKASGTIALCKHNRLMITSPRDMIFGYDWLNTLAHEYIHYVIIKASHNQVPIWLHEGLAKFFENRWRGPHDAVMSPSSQDLLAKGLEKNELITFQQMSPSMAKLPSQEAAALAFAEVFTVADYLKRKRGEEGVRQLIAEMRDGRSDREAVEAVLGVPFAAFEADWRAFIDGLELVQLEGDYAQKLYFRNSDTQESELDALGQEEAENHAYLGDRLRAKKRLVAAMKEYNRAVEKVGPLSPLLQARLAATHLDLGNPREALAAVEPPLRFYRDYVLLYIHAGRAHLQLSQYEQAAQHLEAALELNPFDKEIHEGLKKAYESLGRTDDAQLEAKALAILERG